MVRVSQKADKSAVGTVNRPLQAYRPPWYFVKIHYCGDGEKETMPTRNDAYELMTSHVKNENLRKHMLSVEVAMRFYARMYGEDEELWAMTGLLHDCDYEEYPDLQQHTQVSARWLREGSYDERIIYAILAHNDLNLETHPRSDLLSRAL